MIQETEYERYTRLNAVINSTYEDHELTSDEKREIGEILADSMTPWEFSCDVCGVGDIWYEISESYTRLSDFGLTLEFITEDNCENVDNWIKENGLPLPDRDDMTEHLISDIDEEEYINEYYDDVLDMLPGQCQFNLSDDEIVYLFEVYVDEPDEDEMV